MARCACFILLVYSCLLIIFSFFALIAFIHVLEIGSEIVVLLTSKESAIHTTIRWIINGLLMHRIRKNALECDILPDINVLLMLLLIPPTYFCIKQK